MRSSESWVNKLSPWVERDFLIQDIIFSKNDRNDFYPPELQRIHFENAQKLKALITKIGFPVLSNASEQGVKLSWLIIQHSLPDPEFLREALIQMRLAAGQEDYPLELLAHTEDLVAYLEGRSQIYGTYHEWIEGELKAAATIDLSFLPLRRQSMNLPSAQDSLPPHIFSRPPKGNDEYHHQFEKWLKQVGWRI
jgi:hypothetical protein